MGEIDLYNYLKLMFIFSLFFCFVFSTGCSDGNKNSEISKLEQEAKAGKEDAQHSLGIIYLTGVKVKTDYKKTYKYVT